MRHLFKIARQHKTDLIALVIMVIGLSLPLAIFTTIETWGMMP